MVDVQNAGGSSFPQANVVIYGVAQKDMVAMSILRGLNDAHFKNTMDIYAVDDGVPTLIFQGNLLNCWVDYQSMPDVCLRLQSVTAAYDKLKPVPPTSYKGKIDVATVINLIASSMGFAFENNGVNVTLTDIYLPNTAVEQIVSIAKMAKIDVYFENNTIAICPSGVPRGGIAVLVSPSTGLVGYPTFDSVGVNFQTLFNPAIRFGAKIKVESDLPLATGEWTVTSVSHKLESEKPGGAWFTTVRGTVPGLAVTTFG
jgi:hypothetical protein